MPGATPVLGLPYPYETEPITVADFANLANAIEDARASTAASAAAQLTTRPLVRVQSLFGQTSATGVSFNASFDPLASRITDNSGMFSTGAPTLLTVRQAGMYVITAHDWTLISGFGTVDNVEIFINVNGLYICGERGCGTLSALLPNVASATVFWPCYVGDVITLSLAWTGAGGPATWHFNSWLSASYICPLI